MKQHTIMQFQLLSIILALLTLVSSLSSCGGGSSGGGGSADNSSQPEINITADSSGNGWASVSSLNQIQEYSSNPSNQALEKTISLNNPLGLTFDNSGNLWVANGQSLSEYDASGTLTRSIAVNGAANRVTFCSGDLWTTFTDTNSITEYDPTTGQQISTFLPTGTPRSLTCDSSGNLWITYTNTNVIQEYNPASPDAGPLATITPPNNPYGIAYCGGYLWVTNTNTNTIDEIDPNGGYEVNSYIDPSGLIAENITPSPSPNSCNDVWYAIPTSGTQFSGEFKLLDIQTRQLIVAYGIPAPDSSGNDSGSLPSGFPSSLPTGTYTVTGQACVTGGGCTTLPAETIQNTDINSFASTITAAFQAGAASAGSSGCSSSQTYTPWNGSYFSGTLTVTCTSGNQSATATVTLTITLG